MRITETIHLYDRELEVTLKIDDQPEEHTLRNGDPGTPRMVEVELEEVSYMGRDYLKVLQRAESLQIGVSLIDVENKAIEKY